MKYEIDKGKLEAGMHEHAKNAINAYQRVVDSTKKQLPLIFESKDKHTRRSNYDLFKGAFDRLTEINKSNLEFAREYLGNLDIQRKQMSRKGSQFHWVGATVPNTRGGRRAHPPKAISMINTNKINKKELKIAFCSALSATASQEWLNKRYATLNTKLSVPFIVESKFTELKVKELKNAIEKIIGKELTNIAFKNKTVRAGRGKLRGRKYKSNQGVLLVVGKDEKLKTKNFDIQNTAKLGINDLAKGKPGRLTIYTEKAVEELGEKLKR
jgi:ribosomal protein L4